MKTMIPRMTEIRPLNSIQPQPGVPRILKAVTAMETPSATRKIAKMSVIDNHAGGQAIEKQDTGRNTNEARESFHDAVAFVFSDDGKNQRDDPAHQRNSPRNRAITKENNRGEPMAEKPTKIERMPPMISQPRLFERSFAAEDEKDSFAIDRGICSAPGDGNCFFGHLENTPGVCQAACFAAPNKIGGCP